MDRDELIAILADECRSTTEAAAALDEADFARPTRLPLWNVKELVGHMWRDMDRLRFGLATEAPAAADTDAVSYWRRYDPAADGPAIAERSREVAAGFATGAELVTSFMANWTDGLDAARAEAPDRVIVTWGPALRLDEFLKTRILELGIHGLDLADALGVQAWLTPGAAEVVRSIFDMLLGAEPLGAEPPAALGWSDAVYLDTGSGRRRLTDDERVTLGTLGDAFPLMG